MEHGGSPLFAPFATGRTSDSRGCYREIGASVSLPTPGGVTVKITSWVQGRPFLSLVTGFTCMDELITTPFLSFVPFTPLTGTFVVPYSLLGDIGDLSISPAFVSFVAGTSIMGQIATSTGFFASPAQVCVFWVVIYLATCCGTGPILFLVRFGRPGLILNSCFGLW